VFQIFFIADSGKTAKDLMKSVFVEKLVARGYEVILSSDALDDVLFANIKKWKCVPPCADCSFALLT
jgi:heat shock protein beta